MHALVPKPRATVRALPAGPVGRWFPFFGRARGLRVRPDARPVQERHAELDAALLRRREQPLPYPELGPPDKELPRPPPRAVFRRDRPPARPVRVPPDDRPDRLAQVPRRGLPLLPARLPERRQRPPPLVRQHHPHVPPTR